MTLTAVEAGPKQANSDEAKEGLLSGKTDEEVVPTPVHRQQRLTASLRDTIRHLRSQDGFRWPFRGVRALVWHNIVFALGTAALSFVLSEELFSDTTVGKNAAIGNILSKFIMRMALANMFVVTTHAIIASTSTNNSYGTSFLRVVKAPWKNAVPTLLPLGIISVSTMIAEIFSESYTKSLALHASQPNVHPEPKVHCGLLLAVIVGFFASIVSSFALIRMHASSMPKEDTTVISVDATFNVIPASQVSETEVQTLTFRQALSSYTKEDIKHILKSYGKIMLCIMGFYIVVGAILFVEAKWVMSSVTEKMIRELIEKMQTDPNWAVDGY